MKLATLMLPFAIALGFLPGGRPSPRSELRASGWPFVLLIGSFGSPMFTTSEASVVRA
jgi:hypothetical protein